MGYERGLLTSFAPNRVQGFLKNVQSFLRSHVSSVVITIAASSIAVFFNFIQNQSEDKSKNDSIKIVSRGHLPPAPAKGASRAAKMRAVARGDDTASTLKHEQQVSCDFFAVILFLEVLITNKFRPFSSTARPLDLKSLFPFDSCFRKRSRRC